MQRSSRRGDRRIAWTEIVLFACVMTAAVTGTSLAFHVRNHNSEGVEPATGGFLQVMNIDDLPPLRGPRCSGQRQ